MNSKKLFLLDAFALIYRAYFAFAKNPLINSKGQNVSAITGFTNTLLDLIEKEKPTHLAVVFDMAGPTDRAVEHDFYKANRQEMPEDIRTALPYIHQIIEAFHIPILGIEGYEADDLIGTLAKQKSKEGYLVYMVTPDKDFCQLVEENILIYKPGRQGNAFEILGVDEVKLKWEVDNPLQVIDILGMWGDSVDNIPGIPGVGEKTAKKLIAEFGSMENVIANADKIKGKVGENIANYAEQGVISKKLATIITDAPLHVSDEDLLISEPNKEALHQLFTELEFRTIGRRVLGADFSVNTQTSNIVKNKTINTNPAQADLFGSAIETSIAPIEKQSGKNINNTHHTYYCITEDNAIDNLIQKLLQAPCFCFDTETTGLDTLQARIVGMSFSIKENEAYYVPVDKSQSDIVMRFACVFENESIAKIGQHIKFDMLMLLNYDIQIKGALYDTMLMHYLLEPDMRHNMDFLSETYLGYTPIPIESLIGKKGKGQLAMSDVPLEKISDYAAEDADITLQLYNYFLPKAKDRDILSLLNKVESPLIPVLAHMERQGVQIDTSYLKSYSDQMRNEIVSLQDEIYKIAGVHFNLDSPKQLGEILFDKLGIPYTEKKTATGQYSTNEETLLKIDHEIVDHILEYREYTKLKSTYVDALPALINPKTGRLHTTFNQTIAATGRLSSVSPNLQNIPIRTERGKKIRKAFIPRNNDHVIFSADYSQIELRIIASISNEKNMIADFEKGLDIHTATAAKVYGISPDEVSKTQRSNAKMVNFGIIYAISAFGLSQRLGIPRKEAASLIENYFIQYPGIKNYMNDTLEFAKQHGYVKTILGRRRYLKDIRSANHTVRSIAEREAINAPIQGSAADLIKVAMIQIHDEFTKRNLKSAMTLQVHDELVFDVFKPELEEVRDIVVNKMQNAIPMNVPILVETGYGSNWLEAH